MADTSTMTTRRVSERKRVEARERARQAAPGYRPYERRLRDASFFLVERRKGRSWMYGSIALAAALWTYVLLRQPF